MAITQVPPSLTGLRSFLSQVIEDPIQVERVKFVFETENGLLGKYGCPS